MQRYSLQPGTVNPGDTGCAFLSGYFLEAGNSGNRRLVRDDIEERRSNRHAYLAGQLCGSRLLIRQAASRRRRGVLSAWAAVAGAAALVLAAHRTQNSLRNRQLISRSSLGFFVSAV